MEFCQLPDVHYITDMEFDPCWGLRNHYSKGIELIHIVSGTLELVWDDSGERFNATAGQTLLNPPGMTHRDEFDFDAGVQVLIVHFDWKHFDEFYQTVNNHNINDVSNTTSAQLKRLFDDIKLDSGPGENNRMLDSVRLMHILMLIYREQATEKYAASQLNNSEQSRHRIVADAKKYLDKNFSKPVRLEDVANELQISTFYLSRVFSSESDFSLSQYLTDVRMNEAKKLLRANRHIINDIAELVGYESLSYFSKVFKKHVGCAPSQYGKIQDS